MPVFMIDRCQKIMACEELSMYSAAEERNWTPVRPVKCYTSMALCTAIQRSTTLPDPNTGLMAIRFQNDVPSFR